MRLDLSQMCVLAGRNVGFTKPCFWVFQNTHFGHPKDTFVTQRVIFRTRIWDKKTQIRVLQNPYLAFKTQIRVLDPKFPPTDDGGLRCSSGS